MIKTIITLAVLYCTTIAIGLFLIGVAAYIS